MHARIRQKVEVLLKLPMAGRWATKHSDDLFSPNQPSKFFLGPADTLPDGRFGEQFADGLGSGSPVARL